MRPEMAMPRPTDPIVTIDRTGPSVILASTAPASTRISPIPVTVTFMETVADFDSGDVTVANGSVSDFIGTGMDYSFNVTPAGQGEVLVDIADSKANDAAGNRNTAATTLSCNYDNILPTVIMTSMAPEPTRITPIPVTVTFAEAVTGFEEADITAVNGTISGLAGSGASYSFNLNASGQGLVSANIAGNVALDASGNGNTAAPTFSRTYDTISPGVSLTTGAADPTNASIPITITFTESVINFTSGDITLTNGTVSNFSGSGANYTFTLVPTAQGSVSVSIAAGVAQDPAGNLNTASNSLSRIMTISPRLSLYIFSLLQIPVLRTRTTSPMPPARSSTPPSMRLFPDWPPMISPTSARPPVVYSQWAHPQKTPTPSPFQPAPKARSRSG